MVHWSTAGVVVYCIIKHLIIVNPSQLPRTSQSNSALFKPARGKFFNLDNDSRLLIFRRAPEVS